MSSRGFELVFSPEPKADIFLNVLEANQVKLLFAWIESVVLDDE